MEMNADTIAAFELLSRMRFACGDDGKRMQDELEIYLRELKRDALRYRWLRLHLVNWCPDDDTARLSWHAREVLDAEIDSAMNGANAGVTGQPRKDD